jgi:hypothetical protein
MTEGHRHSFVVGDRVASVSRRRFPLGTVVKCMESGYLLVRWDGHILETAHHRELVKADHEGPEPPA